MQLRLKSVSTATNERYLLNQKVEELQLFLANYVARQRTFKEK
jgi:hypothetical protein